MEAQQSDTPLSGQKRKEQEHTAHEQDTTAALDASDSPPAGKRQRGTDDAGSRQLAFDKGSERDTAAKFAGEDSVGSTYESEDALWRSLKREEASEAPQPGWYKGSEDYWAKVEPTLDGVLGGFGFLSAIDIKTSRQFLSTFISSPSDSASSAADTGSIGNTRALDCGAGIGRITRDLLLDLFDRVDLVEPDSRFLTKAKQQLSPLQPLSGHRVDEFFCEGLQSFVPLQDHYDLVWIQWVIGYLTDADLIAFLKRCKEGLRKNGLIVVKDNLNSKEGFYVDKEDNSITRSDTYLRRLFAEAGLTIVKEAAQEDFPPGMLPVRMYGLRSTRSNEEQHDGQSATP